MTACTCVLCPTLLANLLKDGWMMLIPKHQAHTHCLTHNFHSRHSHHAACISLPRPAAYISPCSASSSLEIDDAFFYALLPACAAALMLSLYCSPEALMSSCVDVRLSCVAACFVEIVSWCPSAWDCLGLPCTAAGIRCCWHVLLCCADALWYFCTVLC